MEIYFAWYWLWCEGSTVPLTTCHQSLQATVCTVSVHTDHLTLIARRPNAAQYRYTLSNCHQSLQATGCTVPVHTDKLPPIAAGHTMHSTGTHCQISTNRFRPQDAQYRYTLSNCHQSLQATGCTVPVHTVKFPPIAAGHRMHSTGTHCQIATNRPLATGCTVPIHTLKLQPIAAGHRMHSTGTHCQIATNRPQATGCTVPVHTVKLPPIAAGQMLHSTGTHWQISTNRCRPQDAQYRCTVTYGFRTKKL